MLSRVAERIYWLTRYMERAENTARLIKAYSYLLLDLPKGTRIGWDTVIAIFDDQEPFARQYAQANEHNVTHFMLARETNPSSIFSSLTLARENARTSREIIPSEAWELINGLYLEAKDHITKSISHTSRDKFLSNVINGSQQFTGLMSGCMSHNHTYDFVIMGRNIERADMSSRIIDVGAATLYKQDSENTIPYENALWVNVLRSLSAYQMYRQRVRARINAEEVVEFLLKDEVFPRAIQFSLNRIVEASRRLPNNRKCIHSVDTARNKVHEANPVQLLKDGGLHDSIDRLQIDIANIHQAISATWFLNNNTVNMQTQARA